VFLELKLHANSVESNNICMFQYRHETGILQATILKAPMTQDFLVE
jgi:hypothetical protein